MIDEALIQEAAKAIYETRDDQYDLDVWEQLDSAQRERYVCDARAAWAVFEAAHTPTNDEREALRRIIAQGSYSRSPEDLPYADVADRLAAAGFGFRRSEVPERTLDEAIQARDWDTVRRLQDEVPEPSAEGDEFAQDECDGSGTCPARRHVHGCYTRHRADQCDSPEEYGHLPAEPQGEQSGCSNPDCPLERAHSGPCAPKGWPSDEVVLAALNAYYGGKYPVSDAFKESMTPNMRAALRAAAEVGGVPEVRLLACTQCGVIVWDIDAHYEHAHAAGVVGQGGERDD